MTTETMISGRKWLAPLAVALIFAPALSVGQESREGKTEEKEKKWTTTDSGLKVHDVKKGTGATPREGQRCVVEYTLWLWENDAKGKKVDSSKDHGGTFPFTLGVDPLIKGWVEGVSTMKVGGKRELIIPPDLGYGARGAGGVIPPNATLFFELVLKDVQ